jgi:hypothetical protein
LEERVAVVIKITKLAREVISDIIAKPDPGGEAIADASLGRFRAGDN